MIHHLLFCLFGIAICFLVGTVAREAILNGIKVESNMVFLYQVSVQVHGRGHVCGGGIIGDLFILTAAQCVLNRTHDLRSTHISVLAGTTNLNEIGPLALTIRVAKVYFPREFHPTMEFKVGDIAVLRLAESLPLEHHHVQQLGNLGKLELPRNHHSDMPGSADIAGFGWNNFRLVGRQQWVGSTDGHLRNAMTDVYPDEQCARRFPSGAIEVDKHICAKFDTIYRASLYDFQYGVCTGDQGGPLVHNETIIIGILSRVPYQCNESFQPAVYTRITHYARSILNVMQRGHDPHMILLHT